jgi:hypothetical protein
MKKKMAYESFLWQINTLRPNAPSRFIEQHSLVDDEAKYIKLGLHHRNAGRPEKPLLMGEHAGTSQIISSRFSETRMLQGSS